MAKRVQVVLNKDISKLGKSGDLLDVAPGYARNYLVPQGLAMRATPGVIKQVERRREKERQRLLEVKQQAEARKTALATIGRLRIEKQAGEGNAIFGTVTAQDIADIIQANINYEVDKRGITVPEISTLGVYKAEVRLHPEVISEVEFEVMPAKGEG
ncbi:50S ribosomal protein L9 [Lusitaniella coriacea LEGE 07157]|uniref:Large ribosomal subunit protein bL9 n=1 Tax=Lusitaniella coriacea LEGE 07157 TaxID=945747 RepID=A0A8J7IU80_9CYAN|nr:50S ribosomal protein L9 [Lusitaniella coriacea]MBE9117347.1 50S ribosomal protein L9 [Lusitaniella coriacea LEGE 07157]